MKMPISDAAIAALLGYGVVFLGLFLLMCVIILMGKVMTARKAGKVTVTPGTDGPTATVAAPVKEGPAAPGSAGEVKLFDVGDKEAAMLMAIVADKLGKPLNELRFKSIKEVK